MPVTNRAPLIYAQTLDEEGQKIAEGARELARELRKFKYMMNHSFVQAGRVLHKLKTEKLYKYMGYKSMTEFLADPEYGMAKATAYLYMALYEYYIVKRGMEDEQLMDIDIVRLRAMLPVIRSGGDLDEWLIKARVLGKGDFFSEVNEASGRAPSDILAAMPDEDEETVIDTTYLQIVKGSPCCVCDKRPVDAHHFPRTKGAGNIEDRTIPLCRDCHRAFHDDPKAFFWTNRIKIMDWFYDLIETLIEEAKLVAREDTDIQDIPEGASDEHE
jgi:hypothetical protein